jgi:DNA-binding transcriptional regulator YiaG
MSSLGTFLKTEIARLSRREIRSQVEPVKKQSAIHRKHIAALKRQVVALERLVAQLRRGTVKAGRAAPAAAADDGEGAGNSRFSAKGFKTLRARLGLSAADVGKILGVSGQSVYNWEARKSVPRKSQLAALASLRGMGKREAQAKLETVAAPKKKRGRKAKAA